MKSDPNGDARALWAVRVLDAWAEGSRDGGYPDGWTCMPWRQGVEAYKCCLSGNGGRIFYGGTADAARLAAAEALASEDPILATSTAGAGRIYGYRMKHETQSNPKAGAPVDSGQRRIVVYSPETTAAYGAVIDVGMIGNADEVLVALRYLAQMVHSDFTGELRLPHTHTVSGIRNGSESRE